MMCRPGPEFDRHEFKSARPLAARPACSPIFERDKRRRQFPLLSSPFFHVTAHTMLQLCARHPSLSFRFKFCLVGIAKFRRPDYWAGYVPLHLEPVTSPHKLLSGPKIKRHRGHPFVVIYSEPRNFGVFGSYVCVTMRPIGSCSNLQGAERVLSRQLRAPNTYSLATEEHQIPQTGCQTSPRSQCKAPLLQRMQSWTIFVGKRRVQSSLKFKIDSSFLP